MNKKKSRWDILPRIPWLGNAADLAVAAVKRRNEALMKQIAEMGDMERNRFDAEASEKIAHMEQQSFVEHEALLTQRTHIHEYYNKAQEKIRAKYEELHRVIDFECKTLEADIKTRRERIRLGYDFELRILKISIEELEKSDPDLMRMIKTHREKMRELDRLDKDLELEIERLRLGEGGVSDSHCC